MTRLRNTKLTATQMSEKGEEEEDGMSGGEEGREGGLVPFPAVAPSGHPATSPHSLRSAHRASISSLHFSFVVHVQRDASEEEAENQPRT